MGDRASRVERLCDRGVIGIIRAPSGEQLIEVAEALLAGGVDCIEITMTTPNALQVLRGCQQRIGDRALVGVGSVLDAGRARDAVAAGAEFVVSPVFDPAVLEAAHDADAPCVPGAFTPTEIFRATLAGADIVKVFPAGMFGPKYFRALLAPMPHLRLSPTGGVNLDTAADWIAAGAVTLGIGSALVTKQALADRDTREIQRLAADYVRIVAEARAAQET